MNISSNSFRNLGRNWPVISREVILDDNKLIIGKSRFAERISNWANSVFGKDVGMVGKSEDRLKYDEQASKAKQTFMQVLKRNEGNVNAEQAIRNCGLPTGWESNGKPLTSRQIHKVLDSAQAIRKSWTCSLSREMKQLMLKHASEPYARDLDTELRSRLQGVDYTTGIAVTDAAKALYDEAKRQVEGNMARLCQDRFPGLSRRLSEDKTSNPGLSTESLHAAHLVAQVRLNYNIQPASSAEKVLSAFEQTTVLLKKEAWDQNAFADLDKEIATHRQVLTDLKNTTPDPAGYDGIEGLLPEFYQALHQDLDRQIVLLDAKQHYLTALRENDPLSGKALAKSDLLWTNTVEQLLTEKLLTALPEDKHNRLVEVLVQCRQKFKDLQAVHTKQDAEKMSLPAPNKHNKKTHVVALGKKKILDILCDELKENKFDNKDIKSITSKSQLKLAQTKVLARSPEWVKINRKMLIVRDGAVSQYQSIITPAQYWDEHFKKSYAAADGNINGVTAGDASNTDHARNLKVSQLMEFSGTQPLMTVIGHGVLDMWKIQDRTTRETANKVGAKEVVALALASNPRLRQSAINGNDNNPRLIHVSVNLISPDTLRSTGWFEKKMPDYAEKDFTRAQFAAFEANSGAGQTLQLWDEKTAQVQEVKVDVDTITFSFGINSIASSPKISAVMLGVWHNVHAHNRNNMIKLIGDLGQGRFGARGTLPGGFIGEVYDRLKREANAVNPNDLSKKQALETKMQALRVQTNTVRQMFTERSFESGRGDTAKMGREILMLQGLAEQALASINARDMAATMSKGCKSDKDRGGVTDVELKAQFILREMGGNLEPDAQLVGDDQRVYNVVSASSGQIENQSANTGLGGSKEAGHLKERLPDPNVRDYLMGLALFAAA